MLDEVSRSTTPLTSFGNLSDSGCADQVSMPIQRRLPKDVNGVYFVLTHPTSTRLGFLPQYCGWHPMPRSCGSDISIVRGQCGPLPFGLRNPDHRPNKPGDGCGRADGMANTMCTNELEEAPADPT